MRVKCVSVFSPKRVVFSSLSSARAVIVKVLLLNWVITHEPILVSFHAIVFREFSGIIFSNS